MVGTGMDAATGPALASPKIKVGPSPQVVQPLAAQKRLVNLYRPISNDQSKAPRSAEVQVGKYYKLYRDSKAPDSDIPREGKRISQLSRDFDLLKSG